MSGNPTLGEWPMIPANAFLYFPAGNEVKEGENEKQWRKIFEDGTVYDDFENKKIESLEQKLTLKKIKIHDWFDRANKLRFLQANKFDVQKTCDSIKEGTSWRQKFFPLKQNPEISTKLNEGAIYFCGRDQFYRPILVVEVIKMKQYSEQIIQGVLNNLLEYCLENLLIPGQVQNYVLLINLDEVGISDLGQVSKLVSFTSNTYRSRLFASYLLNASFMISSGWNGIATKIVSQNTLKKIKISREESHEDMWTHIDKDIVEEKYGGTLPNQKGPFWPPHQKLMNHTTKSVKIKHLTKQQYNRKFKSGQLSNRKVKQHLIQKQHATPQVKQSTKHISTDHRKEKYHKHDYEHYHQHQTKHPSTQSSFNQTTKNGVVGSPSKSKMKLNIVESLLPPQRIKKQILVPIKKRNFKLFFEDERFKGIFELK